MEPPLPPVVLFVVGLVVALVIAGGTIVAGWQCWFREPPMLSPSILCGILTTCSNSQRGLRSSTLRPCAALAGRGDGADGASSAPTAGCAVRGAGPCSQM